MGLRWAEGDRTHQGLRGFWPERKPADGEGRFVATVAAYGGGAYFRCFFQRFTTGDQPIRCWFTCVEDAIAAADEWFDSHPEMHRPVRR